MRLLKIVDKESRNDSSKAGACAVHAGIQTGGGSPSEGWPGHRGGTAKVLGIPKASLGNWVRLAAKGELLGVAGNDKVVNVSPEQMEIARLRAEVSRLRMERDIAKKAAAYFAQDTLRGTPGYTK
jgi:transposase